MWPVRQAERQDWPAIQRFFKNLDPSSRYMYFGGHVTDAVIDHIWDRFHIQEHRFFVVEFACNIIGVCQIAHKDHHAEISVAVSAKHRKQGIAHSLVERAVTWCKTHNIEDVMMFCLPNNDVIPKILKKHNLLPLMLAQPAEAKFAVPNADLSDLQKEYYSSWLSHWLNWAKRKRLFFQS
jgi:N-acetylglutamate synthase-like GNAT family acetyltransferase